MKANELMIGDWVSYNPNVFIEDEYESTKACYPIQINSGEDIDLAEEGCYAPIPLTPKILEKNRFIRDGESWWYMDFRIVLSEAKGVALVCGRQVRFNYVHELQHALRLCGIDKEIEL